MGKRLRLTSALILPTLLILLPFNNCSGLKAGGALKVTATTTQSNGGEGYDGKPFISRLLAGLCPDGTDVRSKIQLNGAGTAAALVRDNCATITPVPLTLNAVQFLPHNISNMVFGAHPFDVDPSLSNDARPSRIFGRGQNDPMVGLEDRKVLFDFILKDGPTRGSFLGKTRFGLYAADGSLIKDGGSEETPINSYTINNDGTVTVVMISHVVEGDREMDIKLTINFNALTPAGQAVQGSLLFERLAPAPTGATPAAGSIMSLFDVERTTAAISFYRQ